MSTDTGGTPDPAYDLVDEIVQRLIEEPDPATRWCALRLLLTRFDLIRKITVRQLAEAEGSHPAVGRILGITRGRVTQLAGGAVGPTPAYAWGRALGVARTLAELGERRGSTSRFADEHADLLRAGMRSPAGRSRLGDAVQRWAMAARRNRHGELVDHLLERLEELLADAAAMSDSPTLEERGEVALGYHRERADLADELPGQ